MINGPIKREDSINPKKSNNVANKSSTDKSSAQNAKQDNFSKFLKDPKFDKNRTLANTSNKKILNLKTGKLENIPAAETVCTKNNNSKTKIKSNADQAGEKQKIEDIKEVHELYDKPLRIKSSLKYSISSGSSFAAMEGFGSFIGAFAVALNATATMLGLISSLPDLIGSFFQLSSVKIAEVVRNRKLLIVAVAFIQALLWIPLLLIPFIFKTNSTLVLLLLVTAIASCSLFINPISISLMGDLVPCEERGKYFGKRSRYTNISLFTATFVGGMLLNYISLGNKLIDFSVLFGMAFLFRLISVYYFSRMYDPGSIPEKKEDDFTFFQFFKRIRKNNYGRFVLYMFFFRFAVNIVAPFFTLYMLKDLHFDYLHFTLVALAPVLAAFFSLNYWGRMCDNIGSKNVLLITGFLIPLSPLLWLLSPNFYYLVVIEFLAGFAWAGFNLSSSNFVYDATSSPKRIKCVSYLNLLNNSGLFIGATVGGLLLKYGHLGFFNSNILISNNILILCAISGILRLVISLIFLPTLREARLVELFGSNQPFDKRIITIHPRPKMTQMYEPVDKTCGKCYTHMDISKETKPVLHTMVNTLQFSRQGNAPVSKSSNKKMIRNTPYEPGSFKRK